MFLVVQGISLYVNIYIAYNDINIGEIVPCIENVSVRKND